MPNRSPRLRRRARAFLLAGAFASALAGCARSTLRPPHLAMELAADHVSVRVDGAAGMDVYLMAARPWHAEQELLAGVVGLRREIHVLPADVERGAGVLQRGRLTDDSVAVDLPIERLAALPLPAAIQVLAVRFHGAAAATASGRTYDLAATNAYRLDRRDGALVLQPWPAVGLFGDEWPRLLWALLLPAVVFALLRRVSRRPPLWPLIGIALLAAAAARCTADLSPAVERGEAAPPVWVSPTAIDVDGLLERCYGGDAAALVRAIAAARRDGEALTFALGTDQKTGRELLAAILAQRCAPARVVAWRDGAAMPGLLVELTLPEDAAARRPLADLALPPDAHVAREPVAGETLHRSALATLSRVGVPR